MTSMHLTPRISEKSYNLSTDENTYVFVTPLSANKLQIKQAIEDQYNVKVLSVRTLVVKGKAKTTPLRRRYPIAGKRKNIKKAFVTLTPGNTISIFEDV